MKFSKITLMHYIKLIVRSILFIFILILYIISKVFSIDKPFGGYNFLIYIFIGMWICYMLEMFLRFIPSDIESMGCQKHLKKNYIEISNEKPNIGSWKRTFWCAVTWILGNLIFGVLYFVNIIDGSILILLSLLYGIGDMICVLFFCPFQTWFIKSRCCNDCRIYNWDFIFLFTPYIFIPHLYTYSLLIVALVILIHWEISYHKHKERFAKNTNLSLSCKNCKEKICLHKKQLRRFIKKYYNNKAEKKV